MKTLRIEWKRLVNDNGRTCERCAGTGEAAEAAFGKLKRCLAEVGIEVLMDKRAIDQSTFFLNPLESNQILIDGRPLEQWIDGSTGQSQCCGPCGDSECRTVTVDGKPHEAIPEHLILRAESRMPDRIRMGSDQGKYLKKQYLILRKWQF